MQSEEATHDIQVMPSKTMGLTSRLYICYTGIALDRLVNLFVHLSQAAKRVIQDTAPVGHREHGAVTEHIAYRTIAPSGRGH